MRDLSLRSPAIYLYHGTLEDTASIIGLCQSHFPITAIIWVGELNNQSQVYLDVLNQWLVKRDYPKVSLGLCLTCHPEKIITDPPYRDWNWGQEECKAVVRLAGLPLPPKLLLTLS